MVKGSKIDSLFLLSCVLLGLLGNFTFFKGPIGISYSIFITVFYIIFFLRFKGQSFQHKQISTFLLFSIVTLTIMYAIFSNSVFNGINYLLIPFLILCHTILTMGPRNIYWYKPSFFDFIKQKLIQTISCNYLHLKIIKRKMKRNLGNSAYVNAKKIAIGILIAFPVVFIVINLLLLADAEFASLMSSIPELLMNLNLTFLWDGVLIVLLSSLFYSFLMTLNRRTPLNQTSVNPIVSHQNWDSIIVATVLVSLNLIYLLFTIVQFQYFFSSGELTTNFTYAEYARRGFFELLAVTLINYVTLTATLRFSKKDVSIFVKSQLTLIILFSGVMLVSAFIRLMMYEQAFGYTYSRIFAHAFMVYLLIIFAFTLIKVWLPRLSMVRFYLLFSLLFYISLNVVGIDDFIITKNIERYETTEEIDIYYLSTLSHSAVPHLVELYNTDPSIDGLESLLEEKQDELGERDPWYSFNFSRERARSALENVELNKRD
ncbi:DUF4173 domain-containing protein [Evansella sp. AB-P1]|uniref:DUF4153 domain-containing protein n=1 Tax=Evansella sp. AB-P1 TaxID=3037653 RepID=UPI00241D7F9F|nr:DUF4173 domain-containing protein [Evansella sp. AB-P1]MDG5786759.1 DUF4173 domain-containing protein [Evansella sp. AB-P1]